MPGKAMRAAALATAALCAASDEDAQDIALKPRGDARLRTTAVSVRYARYHADHLFADTTKLWLALEWGLC